MIWFGKGKVVGTTPDGKVVVDIAGRNVIFENGKQNTISAGSLKKIEIPKTNEVVEVPTEVITKNNTKKVPENTLNGILDKVKSKIAGKPLTQVQLERIGVDGVIVADLGVFQVVKENSDLNISISTQASNTNWRSVKMWKDMGAKRVVLAREISLENIKEIREKVPDIELEVFVHGAMCMAISGRCLLSNYMTGRDANRGDCAQACRWKYSLVEETRPGETMPVYEDEHGTYIFNSKDLCTIEMIDKILDAGVDSLKIEGRMKGIYYVSNCVKVYKDALNSYYSGNFEYNPEWRNELESISNRSYTEGFYHGKAGKESLNYNNRNSYSQTHKLVAKIEKKLSDNEYLVAIRNKLFVGQAVQIVSPEIKVRDFVMPEMILLDKMGRETESVESANPNSFVKIKTDIPMNELDMLRIVL